MNRATAVVNALLSDRGDTLVVSFKGTAPAASAKRTIVVRSLRAEHFGPGEVAFTQLHGACILVNGDQISDRLQRMFAGPSSLGGLSIDTVSALAIVLLHEVGHVVNGDAGQYDADGDLAFSDLEARGTTSVSRELRADQFAASVLAAASRAGAPPGQFVEVVGPGLALSSISFNLGTRRMLDDFGCTVLACRKSFGDRGTSHPNLELRFLMMQHYFNPSPTSDTVLADFLERRRTAQRKSPTDTLFRR